MIISSKNQVDFQKIFQICKNILSSHVSLALHKVVCAKEYSDKYYRNYDRVDGKATCRAYGELIVETVGRVAADRQIDFKSDEDDLDSRVCELGHADTEDGSCNHSDGMALGKCAEKNDDRIDGKVQKQFEAERANKIADIIAADVLAKQDLRKYGGYCGVNKEDNELCNRGYNELGDRHITLVGKLTCKVLGISAGLLGADKVSRYHTSYKERECRRAAENDVGKVYSVYPSCLGNDDRETHCRIGIVTGNVLAKLNNAKGHKHISRAYQKSRNSTDLHGLSGEKSVEIHFNQIPHYTLPPVRVK